MQSFCQSVKYVHIKGSVLKIKIAMFTVEKERAVCIRQMAFCTQPADIRSEQSAGQDWLLQISNVFILLLITYRQ